MTAYDDGRVSVHLGDCLDVLRSLPDASVDAVVTDPPYGLEFMGKEWDAPWQKGDDMNADAGIGAYDLADGYTRLPKPSYTGSTNPKCLSCGGTQRGRKDGTAARKVCVCDSPRFPNVRAVEMHAFQQWCEAWAAECLRVLKPGGHMLAFGGTRTWHRLACAVEDAGFEVRDSIAWLYGSGFPKSLDVSKAIDKAAGATREASIPNPWAHRRGVNVPGGGSVPTVEGGDYGPSPSHLTAPATPDAERWQGWGTALKPAFEPVVVARKPLRGTVAASVLAHGTGALNIDGCRIEGDEDGSRNRPPSRLGSSSTYAQDEWTRAAVVQRQDTTGKGRWPANVVLDESQAQALDEQSGVLTSGKVRPTHTTAGTNGRATCYGADAAGGFTTMETYGDSGGVSRFFYVAKAPKRERPRSEDGTAHPTVKPLDLMRWLVRLVTPPGGLVLDPFAGSGTTVEACIVEGFHCIAIERGEEYLPLILQRIHRRRDPVAAIRQTGDDLGLFELDGETA